MVGSAPGSESVSSANPSTGFSVPEPMLITAPEPKSWRAVTFTLSPVPTENSTRRAAELPARASSRAFSSATVAVVDVDAPERDSVSVYGPVPPSE